jgi:hypothetical protein
MARGAPSASGPLRPRHAAQAGGRAEADPLVGVTGVTTGERAPAQSGSRYPPMRSPLYDAKYQHHAGILSRDATSLIARRRHLRDLSLARQLDIPARRERGEASELPSPWPCLLAITPAGGH